MRGMYTAGVLDTFLEAGIRVDGVVGVSAGALFGVNYLSRQKGRVIRYNKRFNKDKNYMGLRPLLREGNLISTHYAYRKTPMPRLPLKLLHRSYPQIARQLLCRHETYNNALDLLAQWEKEGKAFVLRPSEPIHIHRTERDPQKLQQVYDLGVKDCREHLPRLRQYLNL